MTAWIVRWGDTIASEPELPGVWRRKDGGFRIRGRAVDSKTGRLREYKRALPDCKRSKDALATLTAELTKIRAGAVAGTDHGLPRFADWAATVFERKVTNGDIESASGRAKWDWALRVHLIPAFGEVYIDRLTREDVEAWKACDLLAERDLAKDARRKRAISGKRYKPQTANTVLEVLRQVTGAASDAFNIADPCRKLEKVDTRRHRTYTYEEPNALKPADVARFLDEIRARFPQHYAFVFLGFTTGLRPSSLRPLRARGAHADVKWDEERLLVRRSHTHRAEVMEATKTNRDQFLALDPEQVSVLRWHLDRLNRHASDIERRNPLAAAALRETELLFPAAPTRWTRGGGLRSASCLDKVFAEVGKAIGLTYDVTPRCMRRTYQDLAREAKVSDIVTRAISGHATETMQHHYSTVSDVEVRAGLAAVIDIATGRRRAA